MERLTEYESIAGHAHAIPIVSDMDVIMMRLAAYEDTGLEPEEIAKLAADRKALINELCGKYKHAHEGACVGCRWREEKA